MYILLKKGFTIMLKLPAQKVAEAIRRDIQKKS